MARVVTLVGELKRASGALSAGHPGGLHLWTRALGNQCEEAVVLNCGTSFCFCPFIILKSSP